MILNITKENQKKSIKKIEVRAKVIYEYYDYNKRLKELSDGK